MTALQTKFLGSAKIIAKLDVSPEIYFQIMQDYLSCDNSAALSGIKGEVDPLS